MALKIEMRFIESIMTYEALMIVDGEEVARFARPKSGSQQGPLFWIVEYLDGSRVPVPGRYRRLSTAITRVFEHRIAPMIPEAQLGA
jgi:hypothetical protein